MRKDKFITLRPVTGDHLYHISSMMITSITDYDNQRNVYTMGGTVFVVKETVEEILNLVDKAETLTFITK